MIRIYLGEVSVSNCPKRWDLTRTAVPGAEVWYRVVIVACISRHLYTCSRCSPECHIEFVTGAPKVVVKAQSAQHRSGPAEQEDLFSADTCDLKSIPETPASTSSNAHFLCTSLCVKKNALSAKGNAKGLESVLEFRHLQRQAPEFHRISMDEALTSSFKVLEKFYKFLPWVHIASVLPTKHPKTALIRFAGGLDGGFTPSLGIVIIQIPTGAYMYWIRFIPC